MPYCDVCKNHYESIVFYEGKWVCRTCRSNAGYVAEEQQGIFDATGTRRDRDWLRDKLEMTRTEKKWHEDIRSRRLMPDGTVRRIKK